MDIISKEDEAFVVPTAALQSAMARLRDEYFQTCEDLGFAAHERPLHLFFLVLGRVTLGTAISVQQIAKDLGQTISYDQLVDQFMATIYDGAKFENLSSAGHTIQ